MMTPIFGDTSFDIALVSPRDQNHVRATERAAQVAAGGRLMVTTRAVLLEIGNSLARRAFRAKAVDLLHGIAGDPKVEVVEVTPENYASAVALYRGRPDKDWGLVDCLSFVVMSE